MGLRVTAGSCLLPRAFISRFGSAAYAPDILISPVVQLFDCRCYFGSHRLQRPHGGFTSS
jgi:hypothetical protein